MDAIRRGIPMQYSSVVFLVILFGAGSTCFGQRTGCPVAEDRSRHDADGIVLDYPSNWQVLRLEEGGVRAQAFLPDGFTMENAPCSLQLLRMPAPEVATLEAAAQWFLAECQKREPRTRQTGPIRRGTLDGSPSVIIPFTGPDENGVDWDSGELIVQLHGREVVALISESSAGTWPRVGPALTKIISSIRLDGGAGSPAPTGSSNPAFQITSGPKQFRHSEFSFQYPGNWGITPGETETAAVYRSDREGTPFYRLQLQPLDGTDNVIVVSYHKFAADKLCGSIAQWMEGVLDVEYTISFFDKNNVTERFPAGAVWTTRASRSVKMPGTEFLRSTVCSNGQVATVVFGYRPGYPSAAREMILRTLSFSGVQPTLEGSWDGTGSVLTFGDDGRAQLSMEPPYQVMSRRGTYRVSGGRVTITWSASQGLGAQQVWNCGYTFSSGELHLDCGRGPQVYRRSGVQ
jgi:hypothetical protein